MKFASFGMIFLVINCLNPSGKSALVDEKFEDLVYINCAQFPQMSLCKTVTMQYRQEAHLQCRVIAVKNLFCRDMFSDQILTVGICQHNTGNTPVQKQIVIFYVASWFSDSCRLFVENQHGFHMMWVSFYVHCQSLVQKGLPTILEVKKLLFQFRSCWLPRSLTTVVR